jgi:hypothetical protein
MPEFYKISFDAEELEALNGACTLQSVREDVMLNDAAQGDLEEMVAQESRADDMLLIKSTVSIFKPGQAILITKEDLRLLLESLERYKNHAPPRLCGPIDKAIEKIKDPARAA